jgi:hypothetical protein
MSKESDLAALKGIADRLDYSRIEQAMWALRWTWGGNKSPPTKSELRATVDELCGNLAGNQITSMSTGGFTVRRKRTGQFQIAFYVDEKDNDE